MKKLLIIAVALILAGCATPFGTRISTIVSAVQNFEVTQGQLDGARNTYDGLVLAPLLKYAQLPRCKFNQKLTMNNPCHEKKLLKQIREADKIVAKAFNDTQDAITSGDSKGAIAAYRALQSAIDVTKNLINLTGVSVLGV